MYCRKCGKEIEGDASFCWNCGERIERGRTDENVIVPRADVDVVPPPIKREKQKGKKPKKAVIIASVVIVCMAAAVFGAIKLLNFGGNGAKDGYALFTDGAAAAFDGEKWGLIDENYQFVVEPQFDNMSGYASEGLWVVAKNSKCGFIDAKGNYVIPPRFDNAGDFSPNGLAPVEVDGKWGYIDTKGEIVIEPQFFEAWGFADNEKARVTDGGVTDSGRWRKYGLIDEEGNYVVEPEYGYISEFAENGLALIRDDKEGYIDENGEFVIPMKFDEAGMFAANGLAPVRTGDDWSYIDAEGKTVLSIEGADWLWPFNEKGKAVVEVDGKYGCIDEKGEYVLEPRYENMGNDTTSYGAENDFRVYSFGTTYEENGDDGVFNDDFKVVVEPGSLGDIGDVFGWSGDRYIATVKGNSWYIVNIDSGKKIEVFDQGEEEFGGLRFFRYNDGHSGFSIAAEGKWIGQFPNLTRMDITKRFLLFKDGKIVFDSEKC